MYSAEDTPQTNGDDAGFTLIELIIVVVIMSVLLTVIVSAVFGIADDADERGCAADQRSLASAVESYFALERVNAIPAAGATNDRFEITLVNANLIREPSEMYDVASDGGVSPQSDSPC